jgi:predicted RNase H-like nuclease
VYLFRFICPPSGRTTAHRFPKDQPGAVFGVWVKVAQQIREREDRKDVADDDILDALAVAWTARRIHLKEAVRIPDGDEERDTRGLPMRMLA